MMILVFGNVVLRYALNSGITMSEEMSRWLFVWMTFLGAIVALKEQPLRRYRAVSGSRPLEAGCRGTRSLRPSHHERSRLHVLFWDVPRLGQAGGACIAPYHHSTLSGRRVVESVPLIARHKHDLAGAQCDVVVADTRDAASLNDVFGFLCIGMPVVIVLRAGREDRYTKHRRF